MEKVLVILLSLVLLITFAAVAAAESEQAPLQYLQIYGVYSPAALKGGEYPPQNVLDWNDENCWQYNQNNTDGNGCKTYIVLCLSGAAKVEWLRVKNGFWAITNGYDQYWRNSRVKDAVVSFQYQGRDYFSDPMTYTFTDEKRPTDIYLGSRDNVVAIMFQIESVYKGEKFDDVAVTHMELFGYQYDNTCGMHDWDIPSMSNAPWRWIAATLNQKMATRTGPGTKYTETHGTWPANTEIKLYRQEMGSGVPWGMVEFRVAGGALVRAYTGMKRVDAGETPPWGPSEPKYACVVRETQAFFGPGNYYMPSTKNVAAETLVEVWGEESGYALVDYLYTEKEYIRVWVPSELLSYYDFR